MHGEWQTMGDEWQLDITDNKNENTKWNAR